MNFLKRLYEKLIYVEDYPDNKMGNYPRRWKWSPYFEHYGKSKNGEFEWYTIDIGIDLNLIQYKGEVREKKDWTPVRSMYIGICYHPKLWKISVDHMYYDGPHCLYQFGPLRFYKSWDWCKKCMPDQIDGEGSNLPSR